MEQGFTQKSMRRTASGVLTQLSPASTRAELTWVPSKSTQTINNLEESIVAAAESNSRIRDADLASTTASLTQHNIMQQAGTAVLANANAQPNMALALLNG